MTLSCLKTTTKIIKQTITEENKAFKKLKKLQHETNMFADVSFFFLIFLYIDIKTDMHYQLEKIKDKFTYFSIQAVFIDNQAQIEFFVEFSKKLLEMKTTSKHDSLKLLDKNKCRLIQFKFEFFNSQITAAVFMLQRIFEFVLHVDDSFFYININIFNDLKFVSESQMFEELFFDTMNFDKTSSVFLFFNIYAMYTYNNMKIHKSSLLLCSSEVMLNQ